MLTKPIDAIDSKDIDWLIENQVDERRTLDYKERLPSKDDSEKAEFCKDISSLANTVGGCLVFGIKEATDPATKKGLGFPDRDGSKGLRDTNLHERIHDLEQILNSGLDPRIQGVEFKTVEHVGSEKDLTILVVRVPNSWQKPHRVKATGKAPFWMRHSKGAFDLSTSEIRQAFVTSEALIDRIRSFPSARLTAILSDECPILCSTLPLVIVHVMPLEGFAKTKSLTAEEMRSVFGSVLPLNGGINDHMYNLEGFAAIGEMTYLQLFRDGCIESVTSDLLKVRESGKNIPTQVVESDVAQFVYSSLKFYQTVNVQPPYYVQLTLANVNGFGLLNQRIGRNPPINKDVIQFPLVEIPESTTDFQAVGNALKPAFDALYNSVHLPRSESYDSEGQFKLQKRYS